MSSTFSTRTWTVPADFTGYLTEERIPEVDLDGFSVSEAVTWLAQGTREIRLTEDGPSDPVIRFHIQEPPEPFASPSDLAGLDPGSPIIKELQLRNVPVLTVLLKQEGIGFWNDESVKFDPSTSRLTMTHTQRSLNETAEIFTQLAIEMSKQHAGF